VKAKVEIDAGRPWTMVDKEDTTAIADMMYFVILDRTAAGRDATGQEFVPYSAGYAKDKGVGVDDVNLHVTGDMMASAVVKGARRKGSVLWRSAKTERYAFIVQHDRPFAGVTVTEVDGEFFPLFIELFDVHIAEANKARARRPATDG
jgi:hypothetical protein